MTGRATQPNPIGANMYSIPSANQLALSNPIRLVQICTRIFPCFMLEIFAAQYFRSCAIIVRTGPHHVYLASLMFHIQMGSQFLEGEMMDEGQEEWLSEGILTDDDYNPAGEQDSTLNSSQDDTAASIPEQLDSTSTQEQLTPNVDAHNDTSQESGVGDSAVVGGESETAAVLTGNIEETLEGLENAQNNNQDQDLPGDLNAFLIRKTDGKVLVTADGDREDTEAKHSDDDGNDTDDLLRMLQDGEGVKKEGAKPEKKEPEVSSDDDDEYIFEGANVRTLRVAKNAVIRKYPPRKAVPEEDDITDASSDEASTMKKMFSAKPPRRNPASGDTRTAHSTRQANLKTTVAKPTKPPLKQYRNKRTQPQPGHSILKQKQETKEDELMEDDRYDLREDVVSDTELDGKQRIMKPEQMDEEVPTDADSASDEESLYDELPSSDSENLDEWFTLDIRAERAGDYIPLLGDKAYQLLLEEKRRVSARLSTLKTSLTSLTDSGKTQAEQLRQATVTLAELDALLKSS